MLLLLLVLPAGAAQQNRLETRLEQAAALIRQNRMAEAEQQLTAILKTAPNEARALNLLGTIRGSQQRFDEAEKLFAHALRVDPRLTGAHMNLAYLYLLKGATDKTITELKAVLQLEPDNMDALNKLAHLLLTANRADECISFLEGAKTARASSVVLLTLLGEAYLSKGDAAKAEASYRAALNKQNDLVEALLGLAQVAQFKGDAKAAAGYLARARPSVAASHELLYQFAMIALKLEAAEDARVALEQAVKLRPDQPLYWLALGDAWLKKPELSEAEQAFRRALELQPENASTQMYLGYALLKQKKYPEARAYLQKSMQASERPETLYYLGVVAQEQSEDEQAVAIMQGLASKFPSFANAHIALGIAYMRLKDYARARQELELAVKLDPEEPKAHYNLAVLFARLKEPARAQEEMRAVERLKKDKGRTTDGELFAPSSAKP